MTPSKGPLMAKKKKITLGIMMPILNLLVNTCRLVLMVLFLED